MKFCPHGQSEIRLRRVKSALRACEIAASGSSVGGVGNAVGIYRPAHASAASYHVKLSCPAIMRAQRALMQAAFSRAQFVNMNSVVYD